MNAANGIWGLLGSAVLFYRKKQIVKRQKISIRSFLTKLSFFLHYSPNRSDDTIVPMAEKSTVYDYCTRLGYWINCYNNTQGNTDKNLQRGTV